MPDRVLKVGAWVDFAAVWPHAHAGTSQKKKQDLTWAGVEWPAIRRRTEQPELPDEQGTEYEVFVCVQPAIEALPP